MYQLLFQALGTAVNPKSPNPCVTLTDKKQVVKLIINTYSTPNGLSAQEKNREWGMGIKGFAILNRVLREGLTEKIVPEQRPAEGSYLQQEGLSG